MALVVGWIGLGWCRWWGLGHSDRYTYNPYAARSITNAHHTHTNTQQTKTKQRAANMFKVANFKVRTQNIIVFRSSIHPPAHVHTYIP